MLHKVKEIAFGKSDLLGMTASLLCIVHCLATPAIISFGYIFNLFQHNHYWDYCFMALAVLAVWFTAKNTQSSVTKWALWSSVSVFCLTIYLHDFSPLMKAVSLLCSVILVVIHFFHWRSLRNMR